MSLPRRDVLLSGAGTLACALMPCLSRAAGEPAPTPDQGRVGAPRAVTLQAAQRGDDPARLSYDGTPSGPLIRVPHGTPLAVTLSNAMSVPTALAWQGLRDVPDAGGPADIAHALPPNAAATWHFTPPDSGTFWFRAAALPGLSDQTAMGLRGLLIVDEAVPPALDHDLSLVFSDAADGTVVVNADTAPWHRAVISGGRVRLRLLNASTERLMVVAVEGARPQIVAVDGQPSSLFVPVRDSVPVAPGARFDLMLDAPREPDATIRVRLRALLPETDKGSRPDVVLAVLTTSGRAAPMRSAITALPSNPALPAAIALERAKRAVLVIDHAATITGGTARWQVNGVATLSLPSKPLLTVPRGTPVTLGLDNRASMAVPLRVQGQAMRLLHAKDDGWEPYWRDGVVLPPRSVTHVAFVPTTAGRWLIESATFDQGAFGLRSWFEVT